MGRQNADFFACPGILETLHLIVQQHTATGEGILYPIAEEALGDRTPDLLDRLRAV